MKRTLIAAALVVASAAHAQFLDGNRLHSLLTGDAYDKLQALGYVMGAADAIEGVLYCSPNNVRAGQLNDMVRNFLNENPSMRHNPADRIIAHVLRTAWPCAQQRRNNNGGGV